MNGFHLRALWWLLVSYVRAVPGMPWLAGIGVACAVLASVSTDAVQRRAYVGAAAVALIATPILFAGNHLRLLGSRRSHALLPGFGSHLVGAALLLHLLLAALIAAPLAAVAGLSVICAVAICIAGCSFLFWFGFIPGLLRLLFACVLIGSLARIGIDQLSGLPAPVTLVRIMVAVATGWLAFAAWMVRRAKQARNFARLDKTHWNLPLSVRVPWTERTGSPAGTLLLGISDSVGMRWMRAVVGAMLIPACILGALAVLGGIPVERLFRSPVMALLALFHGGAFFVHLAQRAASRRPLLWLRGDWSWPQLTTFAVASMWRELRVLGTVLLITTGLLQWLTGLSSPVIWVFALAWIAALAVQLELAVWPWSAPRRHSLSMLGSLSILIVAAALSHVEQRTAPLLLALALELTLAGALWALRRGRAEARPR
jgi:hypothetical protein